MIWTFPFYYCTVVYCGIFIHRCVFLSTSEFSLFLLTFLGALLRGWWHIFELICRIRHYCFSPHVYWELAKAGMRLFRKLALPWGCCIERGSLLFADFLIDLWWERDIIDFLDQNFITTVCPHPTIVIWNHTRHHLVITTRLERLLGFPRGWWVVHYLWFILIKRVDSHLEGGFRTIISGLRTTLLIDTLIRCNRESLVPSTARWDLDRVNMSGFLLWTPFPVGCWR